MARIIWDAISERLYETGTKKGVLFNMDNTGKYKPGVGWNGLVSVKESPEGAEETPIYADDIKYIGMMSAENFKGSIDAFTYPEEFNECNGTTEIAPGVYIGQQDRKPFGFSWETIVGNDTEGNSYGNKLHIVYNSKVSPSEKAYQTVNESPEAITFSWSFSSTPEDTEGVMGPDGPIKPSASVTIDSTVVGDAMYKKITDIVWGTESDEPRLPSIKELAEIMAATPEEPPVEEEPEVTP